MIERSLDTIMALEHETARREAAELRERQRAFEAQHEMPSEAFYQRFRAGELGEAMDRVEWSVFYEIWQSVQERLELLEAESA